MRKCYGLVVDRWRIQLLTCGREVKGLASAEISVSIHNHSPSAV